MPHDCTASLTSLTEMEMLKDKHEGSTLCPEFRTQDASPKTACTQASSK